MMTLMNRFARLFKADVNALLDNLEEPELILKQALRDMQASLDKQQKQLKLTAHNLNQYESSVKSNSDSLTKIKSEIQLCLDACNETLARNLIRKKLNLEAQLKTHAEQIKQLTDSKQILEKSITEKQQSITEIQHKVEIFSHNPGFEKPNHQHQNFRPQQQTLITSEDVDVELLRLKTVVDNKPNKRKTS